MSDTAIKFENISKQYRLGLVSTRTLSHDLNRWWQTVVLGHEDPYLKIGETNDRTKKGTSDYVWALKDIDFSVRQGEVLGIIGKNGAGKSTLLKILSKVTSPTTGRICAKGRIASLLEVGTGFHPELTGRENIYMNGAILGMTKAEITRKLDEIVDFSGVERYLDTPAKRYSSGMTVRLGFAIAAHLEPEILVVDEVLAVGDAEFQKKAIGKMQDVSKGEGRTVLFVSHNMTSIKGLCQRGIWLKNGLIKDTGEINDIVRNYLTDGNMGDYNFDLSLKKVEQDKGVLRIGKVAITSLSLNLCGKVLNNEKVIIELEILNPFELNGDMEIAGRITNSENIYIHYFSSKLKGKVYKIKGSKSLNVILEYEQLPLKAGTYFIGFEIKFQSDIVYWVGNAIRFEVIDNDFYKSGVSWNNGFVLLKQEWR